LYYLLKSVRYGIWLWKKGNREIQALINPWTVKGHFVNFYIEGVRQPCLINGRKKLVY
jgi:hypothetical protein